MQIISYIHYQFLPLYKAKNILCSQNFRKMFVVYIKTIFRLSKNMTRSIFLKSCKIDFWPLFKRNSTLCVAQVFRLLEQPSGGLFVILKAVRLIRLLTAFLQIYLHIVKSSSCRALTYYSCQVVSIFATIAILNRFFPSGIAGTRHTDIWFAVAGC